MTAACDCYQPNPRPLGEARASSGKSASVKNDDADLATGSDPQCHRSPASRKKRKARQLSFVFGQQVPESPALAAASRSLRFPFKLRRARVDRSVSEI